MSICIHHAHNPALLTKLPESAIFPGRFENNRYHQFPLIKVTLLHSLKSASSDSRETEIKVSSRWLNWTQQSHSNTPSLMNNNNNKKGFNNVATICKGTAEQDGWEQLTSDTNHRSHHNLSLDCHHLACYSQDRTRSGYPIHLESDAKKRKVSWF